jgi:hypothetical protein
MRQSMRQRRPSAAMVVAIVALVSSFAGPALAGPVVELAKKATFNGSKIKNRTISGNKLKDNTLTGNQIDESKLGQVPSAKAADTATNATNATKATTATSATTAGVAGQAYTASNTGGGTNAGTVSVTVPAGDYVATGVCTANIGPGGANPGSLDTALTSDNDTGHNVSGFVTVPNSGYSFLGVYGDAKGVDTSGFHLPSGGTITQSCSKDTFSQAASIGVFDLEITATQVAHLNG